MSWNMSRNDNNEDLDARDTRAALRELNKEVQELTKDKKEVQELTKDNEELRGEVEQLTKKLDRLTTEIGGLRGQVTQTEQLRGQVTDLSKEVSCLQAQVVHLQKPAMEAVVTITSPNGQKVYAKGVLGDLDVPTSRRPGCYILGFYYKDDSFALCPVQDVKAAVVRVNDHVIFTLGEATGVSKDTFFSQRFSGVRHRFRFENVEYPLEVPLLDSKGGVGVCVKANNGGPALDISEYRNQDVDSVQFACIYFHAKKESE